MDIQALSEQFGVNVEIRSEQGFPRFLRRMQGRRVLVVTDETTLPLAGEICKLPAGQGEYGVLTLPAREPVADEETVARVCEGAEGYDYILAVGAGTLNDLAKRAGFLTHRPSGVFATAPSMDGYTSGVTPLIEKGFKITRNAQVASDILIDYDVLLHAPRIMQGAGAGDILAKYCCLTDWALSHHLTGEEYDSKAADLMRQAVCACDESIPDLIAGREEGVKRLMDALIISGYAMVIAGNSRPASGAEHHMSHFLEMDFLRRGKRIPLHGVKVGLGTMVSCYLYHTLERRMPVDEVTRDLIKGVPQPEYVRDILAALQCPVRFSQLDVPADTVRSMFFEAYKIRDRFTILTLYCTKGLMAGAVDELMELFY